MWREELSPNYICGGTADALKLHVVMLVIEERGVESLDERRSLEKGGVFESIFRRGPMGAGEAAQY